MGEGGGKEGERMAGEEDGRGGRARRKEGEEGREMAGEEDGRGGRERRSSNVLFAHMI